MRRISWPKIGRDLVVIVLGVLIALAFDGWVGEIGERRLERSYLARLVRDMRADSSLLVTYQLNATMGLTGAQELLRVLNDPDAMLPDSLVSLYFADATRGALISPNTPTLEELTSTGNLRVLEDEELRDALLKYYSEVGRLQRTIETIMGRGREPLAEVGWDIGAFDDALAYSITRHDLQLGNLQGSARAGDLLARLRKHEDAERATRRAVTYQAFLQPVIADWHRQLHTARQALGR